MLLKISAVLTKEQVVQRRATIDTAKWVDGKVTTGVQSGQMKHNIRLPEGLLAMRQVGTLTQDALSANMLFFSTVLPPKVFLPLFNRCAGGQTLGNHADNAVRRLCGTTFRIRSDLSYTLFLTEPEDYDGGELMIDDTFDGHRVKLITDDMVLYPSNSLHCVTPVVRGARIYSFFWLQSMARSDAHRTLLFWMDTELQRLMGPLRQGDPSAIALMGMHHSLLREWTDA